MSAAAPDGPQVDRDDDAVMMPSASAQAQQASPAAAAAQQPEGAAPSTAPAPASPPRSAQQTLHVVASPSKKTRAVDVLALDDTGTSGDDAGEEDEEEELEAQPLSSRTRGASHGGDEEMDDFRITSARRFDATRKPKARKQDVGKEGRVSEVRVAV
jgi:hypothetical protein